MKTRLILAMCALAAIVPVRSQAGSSAVCDGIAPKATTCTATFHIQSDNPGPAPSVQGYIGTVTAKIETDTGSVSMSCTLTPRDYFGNLEPIAHCVTPKFSGAFAAGQSATLTGTITGYLGAPGIGPWQAAANG